LKSGKEFLGYTVEFVDTNAPIDSPYLDELLAEYNNRVEESTNVKVNNKKKRKLFLLNVCQMEVC
jgi:hypothetical protein